MVFTSIIMLFKQFQVLLIGGQDIIWHPTMGNSKKSHLNEMHTLKSKSYSQSPMPLAPNTSNNFALHSELKMKTIHIEAITYY